MNLNVGNQNRRDDNQTRNLNITFIIVRLTNSMSDNIVCPQLYVISSVKPFIDNGAPYRAIGHVKLMEIKDLCFTKK